MIKKDSSFSESPRFRYRMHIIIIGDRQLTNFTNSLFTVHTAHNSSFNHHPVCTNTEPDDRTHRRAIKFHFKTPGETNGKSDRGQDADRFRRYHRIGNSKDHFSSFFCLVSPYMSFNTETLSRMRLSVRTSFYKRSVELIDRRAPYYSGANTFSEENKQPHKDTPNSHHTPLIL